MHDDEIMTSEAWALGPPPMTPLAGGKGADDLGDATNVMDKPTFDENGVDIGDIFFGHRNAGGGSSSGGGEGALNSSDAVADDVSDFLHDFLFFAGPTGGGGSGVIADELHVSDEDLAWLPDPDVFMPTTVSSPDEGASSTMVANGRENGGGDLSASGVDAAVALSVATEMQNEEEEVRAPDSPVSSNGGSSAVVLASPSAREGNDDNSDSPSDDDTVRSRREKLRRQKVERYLEKKKRRVWSRAAPYKSRQRVANNRPRHKGRFLPLESDFVPIAELQRRQRALFKQHQEQQLK